jgi:hypothetical protein
MAEANRHHGSELKPQRKRYTPPRIISREPLEAMAAICRPTPPSKTNAAVCPNGPANS